MPSLPHRKPEITTAIDVVAEYILKNYCASGCKKPEHRVMGCCSCSAWMLLDALTSVKNDVRDFGEASSRPLSDSEVADVFGAVSQKKRRSPQKRKSAGASPARTTKKS